MLSEITVQNVALIESATLRLSPGLNAVTGETGAGKTLLATALQLLLGGRARSEVVRSGAERATMEGVFELSAGVLREILPAALGDLAEEVDPADGLVLRRVITADGRSRCYVNGVSVGVRALAALGERLVSYHGQREQARLADPAEQLALLDSFLEAEGREALKEHAALWREVEGARRELEELEASGEARLRELDFLRYQVREIEASGYSREEVERLLGERERLRNVTGLMEAAAAAVGALAPEEGGGALDAVSAAASELERASRMDAALGPLAERLGGASAELEDVLYELRAYLEELEADPERLEAVEGRLAELRGLERKYGGDVPGYLRGARERLRRLENADEETAGLEEKIARGERRLGELAEKVSAARREAAGRLARRVQGNLEGLNLGGTLFRAGLVPAEPGPLGRERVEFSIRPNPGEPELPVRRHASGGELSRIMLALRLAQREPDPSVTYIFDEVDAGIGGETATAVGARLRELGERCQVITITHLPQIASEASSHVVVSKEEVSGRTVTRVRRVEGEERRRELARMLSGRVDEVSLAHASNLLVSGGG
ncbi:DNA repair protein RecN [Rubrobacter xylanophilus DSM 9941]|uniref:DNA repair protein RecN n=1 Tax=Rubrobacter xylanophilus (strain DSM 9941 / JCM 11954 / NBRC 16129 / PRD-1) TaxID=266117 RepID=Q1AW13_RUBXD|nr:DNA repair protein RecN [Rubrobacter xylanophilus DSM 9941]